MKMIGALLMLAALAGCNSVDSAHRDDSHETPGQVAGREAYEVQKDAKKAAKEISKDLKSFSRDAHEGFQEQKQKEESRKKPDDDAK